MNTDQSLFSIVMVTNEVEDELIVILGWCFLVSMFKRNLYSNQVYDRNASLWSNRIHCDSKFVFNVAKAYCNLNEKIDA